MYLNPRRPQCVTWHGLPLTATHCGRVAVVPKCFDFAIIPFRIDCWKYRREEIKLTFGIGGMVGQPIQWSKSVNKNIVFIFLTSLTVNIWDDHVNNSLKYQCVWSYCYAEKWMNCQSDAFELRLDGGWTSDFSFFLHNFLSFNRIPKTSTSFYRTEKTILNIIWLLGGKIERNEGLLVTFRRYSML